MSTRKTLSRASGRTEGAGRWATRLLAAAALTMVATLPVKAAERLYDVVGQAGGSGGAIVQFSPAVTRGLDIGREFDVLMPRGGLASGQVIAEVPGRPAGNSALLDGFGRAITSTRVVALSAGAGSVEVHMVNNTVAGMTVFDAPSQRVYTTIIDGNGRGALNERNVNDLLCREMPRAPDGDASAAAFQAVAPPLSTLQELESKPGSAKVLYIDYWGGTVTGTAWNANYFGGGPINYQPFNIDSDASTFSDTERYLMYLGWLEASEDYAPFDVNVTTSRQIYLATPVNRRSRIIATPTNFLGYGGVAYVGVFGLGDYYGTGWAWNLGAGSLGMTISHEAGHQMGLGHDGTSSQSYYAGHGQWGPIMGAPFNKAYVQWSKGEYPNADNPQDDLSIISGVLNYVPDEAGGTKATAQALTLPVQSELRTIAPAGHFDDVDVMTFTIPATTTVTVNLAPWLGAVDENRAGNLGINARLENAAGTSIASITSSSPSPLAPNTNKLEFSGTLAAGAYYLFVDAVSPNTNWSSGFGEYGHGGRYVLSVSAAPAGPGTATLIAPNGNITQQSPAYSWRAVAGSTWYRLEVSGTSAPYSQWVSAAAANCPSGTGNCSFQPDYPLRTGAHSWRIQTWADTGEGPWSTPMAFTVQSGPTPGAATLYTPVNGQTVTSAPDTVFTWNPEPTSSWYGIWVEDSTGVVVPTRWFTSATANCAARCSTAIGAASGADDERQSAVAPPSSQAPPPPPDSSSARSDATRVAGAPLADGPGKWWIITWNAAGFGPWSDAGLFNRSAGGLLPRVSSPNAGASLSGTSVSFSWTPASTTVEQYWIEAGSALGANNYFNQSMGSAASGTVTNLPANGSRVYVRFWWRAGGTWAYANYVYTSN